MSIYLILIHISDLENSQHYHLKNDCSRYVNLIIFKSGVLYISLCQLQFHFLDRFVIGDNTSLQRRNISTHY